MKNKLFLLILFISIIHNGQDFSSKKNRMEEGKVLDNPGSSTTNGTNIVQLDLWRRE